MKTVDILEDIFFNRKKAPIVFYFFPAAQVYFAALSANHQFKYNASTTTHRLRASIQLANCPFREAVRFRYLTALWVGTRPKPFDVPEKIMRPDRLKTVSFLIL